VRDSGGEAIFIETDVTREDSVRNSIQQTIKQFGQLDILYNCAGGSIVEDKPVAEVDMFVWQHTTSLDLLGTFNCCRHAISQLIEAGGGAIVKMSSVAALRGFPAHVYVAAKGGIISLTRALAGEYAKKSGIQANAICPALVKTDRVLQRFGDPR
jgi:NAD(P)-dependent dehydrogenase (short-subunit alcohol dehydrogenase family)